MSPGPGQDSQVLQNSASQMFMLTVSAQDEEKIIIESAAIEEHWCQSTLTGSLKWPSACTEFQYVVGIEAHVVRHTATLLDH